MDAELAYVFRHALVRDAAYALQMPAARAVLHRVVLDVADALWGPAPSPVAVSPGQGVPQSRLNPHVDDLARHTEVVLAHALVSAAEFKELRMRLAGYLRRAAELARARYDNLQAALLFRRLAEEFADLAGRPGADALAAVVLLSIEKWDESETLCRRVVADARATGDQDLEAAALLELARVLQFRSRPQQSVEVYEAALALSHELGKRRRALLCMANLATVLIEIGDTKRSQALFAEALAGARAEGDVALEATLLSNISALYIQEGDVGQAEQSLRDTLSLEGRAEDMSFVPYAQGNIAELLAGRGETREAEKYFRASVAEHARVGNYVQVGWNAGALGRLLLGEGRLEEADRAFHQAVAALERTENQNWTAGACSWCAVVALKRGNPAVSDAYFDRALELVRGNPMETRRYADRINAARAAAGLPHRLVVEPQTSQ